MTEWWELLSSLNRALFSAAAFFSVIFVWQLIAAFIGLGGDEIDADVDADTDLDHDGTYDHFEHGADADAVESTIAFKLLSIRSIITFFTLFTWGGALYMSQGASVSRALTY
ncbi:MAG: hypothetical protein KAH23_08640, partial [Kiritimatiellae bacterium]|nr:hypothetical protein [Kiritimatiellia bacterium]